MQRPRPPDRRPHARGKGATEDAFLRVFRIAGDVLLESVVAFALVEGARLLAVVPRRRAPTFGGFGAGTFARH